ncbi:hypothetical protein FOA52_010326 [Chlamydomonas sp. UWO 241]|nr:hypothetical protein FOA52_010326 [Chlamydomonas sp. UWO 241]
MDVNNKYRSIGAAGRPEASLDTLVSRNALAALKRCPPGGGQPKLAPPGGGPSRGAPGASAPTGDVDLIASMAKRLAALEASAKERGRALERVQAENEALKAKLKDTELEVHGQSSPTDSGASGSSSACAICKRKASDGTQTDTHTNTGSSTACASCKRESAEGARLRSQLRAAWAQVAQMKAFLNDYGMVWVGEPGAANGEGRIERRSTDGSAALAPLVVPGFRPSLDAPHHPHAGSGGASPPSSSGSKQMRVPGTIGSPPLPPVGSRPPVHTSMADKAAAPSASQQQQQQRRPRLSSGGAPGPPCPMPRLMAAVDELNQLAGDGEGRLVVGEGGARHLRAPEPVRLVLYRDGMQVHASAPRPYSDASCMRTLQDVLDGYFPHSLKADFPDGVPIKVVDKTSEPMPSSPPGGASSSSAGGGGGGNVHSFSSLSEAPGRAMNKESFLGKLPEKVIRNGKVIEVRGAVGAAMSSKGAEAKGTDNAAQLVSTPADALLNTMQRGHLGPALPPGRPSSDGASADIATLQVKTDTQTFILKLKYDDTIGALRRCIDAHRGGASQPPGKQYEVRSAFPARAYADESETLRAAGLMPNATLFLRAM